MSLNTVLLDLDGVVRHFDQSYVAEVENRHGLAEGSLNDVAFEPELLDRVVTGRISRSDWIGEVGGRVGSSDAAVERFADVGTVDEAMLEVVDGLRSAGTTVAVLTNGTDTIRAEMQELGLDCRFDGIFNSAEIGYAKPDRRAFEYVCRALDVAPSEVFFTDDSPAKLSGATELGMAARVFVGVEQFREHLVEFGFRAS